MEKNLAELQKTQKKGFTTFQPLSTPQSKNKEVPLSVSLVSPSDSIFEPHLIKPVRSKQKEERELKINESSQKGERDVRNPFSRFHNDSNSKAMFSQGSNRPRENQKSAMVSQPIKDESSGSVIESNQWLRENYIAKTCLILRRPIRGSRLYFFKHEKQIVFSKLLWFKPNSKNGRNLIYDTVLHKCQPIFRCGGCSRQFEVPSALGGHLSSCQKKQEHISSLARKGAQKQSPLFSTQQQKLRSSHRLIQNLVKEKQDPNETQNRKEEVIFQSSEQKEKIASYVVPLRQEKPKSGKHQRFKRIVIKKHRSSNRRLRLKLPRKFK